MKLVFLVLAFLFGVILIHADDASKKQTHAQDASEKEISSKPVTELPAENPVSSLSDEAKFSDKAPKGVDNKSSKSSEKSDSSSDHPSSVSKVDSSTSSKSTEKSVPPFDHPEKKPESPVSEHSSHPQSTEHSTISNTASVFDPANNSTAAGKWNVTEGNNTCIVIEGIVSLNVTAGHETKIINVGPLTSASGDCKHKTIKWLLGPIRHNETLQLQFFDNKTTKQYYVGRVDGSLYPLHSTFSYGFKNNTIQAFKTPLNKSFKCGKSIDELLFHNATLNVILTMKDFQIQAFKTSKSSNFDESIDGCPSGGHSGTSDIVPIIVGCALAILVVVVLVSYLINRRRSQAHGYLSM